MADWRDSKQDSRYDGPSAKEILTYIKAFGNDRVCSFGELLRQFGTINEAQLRHHLNSLVNDGILNYEVLITEGFYSLKELSSSP